jgi:DNA-binding NarL/FixJ family response regulator
MLHILIADDHEIFIEALVSLLRDTTEIDVLATGSNGQDALRLVEDHPDADLLVLDVSMPVMDGIDALTELRKRKITIPVLMLTQEYSGAVISRAMKAGASGYLLKTAGRDEFIAAITTVAAGGEYMSSSAKETLLNRLTGRKDGEDTVPLTRAELGVLRLVAAGKTTKEIAEALFISPFTAETHRRNLLQKLKLRNTAELVRYAIENGLAGD